jgi:hypothetical protein
LERDQKLSPREHKEIEEAASALVGGQYVSFSGFRSSHGDQDFFNKKVFKQSTKGRPFETGRP